jgi:hypothetical protein
MKRPFAFFSCAALAVFFTCSVTSLRAQRRSTTTTAPIHGFANPLGSNAAISGQSRPLGGTGTVSYGSPHRGGHYGRGIGGGVYGFATYVPNYWDLLGDPVAGGPYSYTWPGYGTLTPPPPPAAAVPPGPPGAASPTPVIINNYYGYPPPGAEPDQGQPESVGRPGDPLGQPQNYYLIVYKDRSIHAALAYWVEGGTLHYVTTDNAHNQISLDLVDIAASTKLNSDHNVPFSVAGK